jgi:hypothetical protein
VRRVHLDRVNPDRMVARQRIAAADPAQLHIRADGSSK